MKTDKYALAARTSLRRAIENQFRRRGWEIEPREGRGGIYFIARESFGASRGEVLVATPTGADNPGEVYIFYTEHKLTANGWERTAHTAGHFDNANAVWELVCGASVARALVRCGCVEVA